MAWHLSRELGGLGMFNLVLLVRQGSGLGGSLCSMANRLIRKSGKRLDDSAFSGRFTPIEVVELCLDLS